MHFIQEFIHVVDFIDFGMQKWHYQIEYFLLHNESVLVHVKHENLLDVFKQNVLNLKLLLLWSDLLNAAWVVKQLATYGLDELCNMRLLIIVMSFRLNRANGSWLAQVVGESAACKWAQAGFALFVEVVHIQIWIDYVIYVTLFID